MSKVKANNYVTIQGWMVSELGLKGNDLMVYAIIYGFTQTDGQKFDGSLQYLADWCGGTKQGIQKNLKNLLDMGLIEKEDKHINNVKFVSYYATELHGVYNKVVQGIQQSCINNIDNKLEDNKEFISKDINLEKSTTTKKSSTEKEKKPNLYQKCLGMIEEYTEDKKLRELLDTYLRMRLSVKDKPLYGANQWKGLLNKLALIEGNDIDIVQYALERGYLSFYELPKYSAKATRKLVFGENEDNKSEKVTEEEIENGYFTESQF